MNLKIIYIITLLFILCYPWTLNAADNTRFEGCRNKLIQAQKLDLLHDLDWKPPKEPKVVVGPTFFTIPIDAKQNFINTINCFLVAGEDGKFINFNILEWRNGKRIGKYSYGKLKMD